MPSEFDHNRIVHEMGLRIEKDPRYGLVKYFVPWGDTKTDLVGSFYPDVTCMRREGRQKIMLEVLTAACFEDSDEIRRLEGLCGYCTANGWEFYLVCPDDRARDVAKRMIEGRAVTPRAVWLLSEAPFGAA